MANEIIEQMLRTKNAGTISERKNAMKEVIQEVVLCGLSRAGFFQKASFYGGTALRIFYGLDRFSEDLDFSLKVPEPDFVMEPFFKPLEQELFTYGLNFSIESRLKTINSDIKSAFLKGNTKELMLIFYPDDPLSQSIHSQETIKIKFEIDINPPAFAEFERKYRLQPIPYEICLYNPESLFAGKIHAVLCRAWRNRTKGRDLYDYVFYLSRNTKVNLPHLRERMIQTGNLERNSDFDLSLLKKLLYQRFMEIDYQQAKNDVLPFINRPEKMDIWGPEFFCAITENLLMN